MPRTKLIYYAELDQTVSTLAWFAELPGKANDKCHVYLARLESEGHELRRPAADYLRDGIHELRPSFAGVQYRILYFFHGSEAIVVSHGLTKEAEEPAAEIERAIRRMARFRANPARHSFIPPKGK